MTNLLWPSAHNGKFQQGRRPNALQKADAVENRAIYHVTQLKKPSKNPAWIAGLLANQFPSGLVAFSMFFSHHDRLPSNSAMPRIEIPGLLHQVDQCR